MNAERPHFLTEALEPLRAWLDNDQVVEICCNRPGEVWIEILGSHVMEHHLVPKLTAKAIQYLAERVAQATNQAVNEEYPLLSASMPDGERFQAVLPPATPNGGAFAIRKQVIKDMRLCDYRKMNSFKSVKTINLEQMTETEIKLCELLHGGKIEAFIKLAVKERVSMLLSGGTSSGKTTFLNAILKEMPKEERLLTIEDTRELNPIQKNFLPLLASKGDQGTAKVTIESLLQAALRLRPDRIFLGEIRGSEAYSFLRSVNTGHPGSITTVHADSPEGAFEQISLMVMQANIGLQKQEVVDYVKTVLPIVIQQSRIGGWRGTSAIYYSKMNAWLKGRNHVKTRRI